MTMSQKNICITVLGVIFLCFVTSCSFVGDVVSTILTGSSVDAWEGETVSWQYDGRVVQYEVPNNVRTVTLTAEEPVDIFMVKMNVGTTVIPAASTRYIVSASTDEGQDFGGFYFNRSAEEENLLLEIDDWENVSGITPSGFIRKDFIPARDFKPPFFAGVGSGRFARTASVASEPMKSTTSGEVKLGVGEKKELWVDVPSTTGVANEIFSNSSKYTKRNATLRAVGTNCYIWVLDENYSDSEASGAKITREKAQSLADKFDTIYKPIQEVFGFESDYMINIDNFSKMSAVSDTGTKVNIVVYDIEGDYIKEQDSGTAGYFWAKDYYTPDSKDFYNDDILSLSNNGKYFYVDSGFLNDCPEMIYSTLAHEFQHMINFGEKTMESMQKATMESEVLYSDTWSNEMMSMVCEDMVQDLLDIPDIRSPLGRLLYFTEGYYRSGLTDWFQDSNVAYSYAGAYAFGAYLARNYGGKDLINQIATNQYVDQDAITQALKAIGKNESFETVFKKYPQALVLDNPPTGVTVPSFNKSVNGIGGMMSALDLFTMVAKDDRGNTYSFKPILLLTNARNRVNLRPYGFTLHSVVSTNSAGTVNITFSSPVNDNEKIYLLVQPKN